MFGGQAIKGEASANCNVILAAIFFFFFFCGGRNKEQVGGGNKKIISVDLSGSDVVQSTPQRITILSCDLVGQNLALP